MTKFNSFFGMPIYYHSRYAGNLLVEHPKIILQDNLFYNNSSWKRVGRQIIIISQRINLQELYLD